WPAYAGALYPGGSRRALLALCGCRMDFLIAALVLDRHASSVGPSLLRGSDGDRGHHAAANVLPGLCRANWSDGADRERLVHRGPVAYYGGVGIWRRQGPPRCPLFHASLTQPAHDVAGCRSGIVLASHHARVDAIGLSDTRLADILSMLGLLVLAR